MTRWEPTPDAQFNKRLGKSAKELNLSDKPPHCPDIWELEGADGIGGDIAIIGRDMTQTLSDRLPPGVALADDERLVVIPRSMLIAAKPDIPNA